MSKNYYNTYKFIRQGINCFNNKNGLSIPKALKK